MNKHRKTMQKEWEENTLRYPNPIGTTGRRPEQEEFEETVEDVRNKLRLDNQTNLRILDAGSSNGYLMKCLELESSFCTGLDFCYEPLVQGKSLNPEMTFLQGEITQLPFGDQTFDRVICYSLFHYLSSRAVVFQAAGELLRVLAPGGRLLIGDLLSIDHKSLIPEDDRRRWSSTERPFMHQLQNWTFVSLDRICDFLLSKGATLAESRPQIRQKRVNSYRFDIITDK